MTRRVVSVSVDEVVARKVDKLKAVLRREGGTCSAFLAPYISAACDDYYRVHGDGNPAYTLDQFADPSMMATPALGRDAATVSSYLERAMQDPKTRAYLREKLTLWTSEFNRINDRL